MDKCSEKKKKILSVALTLKDGSPWSPKRHDVICNHHFVDQKKSNNPSNPSYAPTIFPKIYHASAINEKSLIKRFERLVHRRNNADRDFNLNCATEKQVDDISNTDVFNQTESMEIDIENIAVKEIEKCDQGCQVDFLSSDTEQTSTFICNRYIYGTKYCDAEVQTELAEAPVLITIKNRIKMKDVGYQCGPSLANLVDKSVGSNEATIAAAHNKKERHFSGVSSIKNDEGLLSLAGVNFTTFRFLLTKTDEPPSGSEITKQQRLLIFLVKMKTGLTFTAIGIFFSLHRTTISTIFFSTLEYLSSSAQNIVFWPTRAAVQKTMPACFKPDYSNTRLIIW
ncbi:uncharacterized protein LOC117174947 [Belonocnema kinseyi]|uniref:uncharacterized protein LOC117174947 n=1 Tax=Belonocnema kinseyi TaxID=2817044 RepID=UPI00143CDB88|nr:uncharacterized protein LOC117174947 [Belonocnema kinseyi]